MAFVLAQLARGGCACVCVCEFRDLLFGIEGGVNAPLEDEVQVVGDSAFVVGVVVD